MIISNTKFKETEIGPIPEEWSLKNLKNLTTKIGSGATPRGGSDVYSDDGPYALIRSQNIFDDKFEYSGLARISNEQAMELSNVEVKEDDVLLNITGASLGRVNIVPKNVLPARVNQHVAILRTRNELNPYFLRGWLNLPQIKSYILGHNAGATREAITKEMIENFVVPVPPISEQTQIAEILSSLDDKIKLNRQMNANLEKVASTLFKHWFVDFEFPDQNGKPYKSAGGKMVDSELGEIPAGWRVGKVGDFAELDRGLSYKGAGLSKEGVPMLNLGTFDKSGGFRLDGLKYYSGEYKQKNLVHPGDIVIANTDITQDRDVLASSVIVPNNFGTENVLFTHHVYALRLKASSYNHFLYYLMRTPQFKSIAIAYATGTTVLFLPKGAILDYKFVMPNKDQIDKFNLSASMIFEKINTLNDEIVTIIKMRDSLLPRLMSGKIRVRI